VDIDTYLSFYAVDGFFIDEMTDDKNTNHLAYYAAIYRYIKGAGTRYRVTGNPGENTEQAYLAEPAADCLMVFENDSTNYPGFVPSDWEAKYPAQQFAHIAYHVNSAAMSNDVELAASRHAGWVYFTDHGYDALPSYWTNEVQLCQDYQHVSKK
jgi:spherulation-specific family 4 protein